MTTEAKPQSLNQALLAFQARNLCLVRNSTATARHGGKYRYADLAAVMNLVRVPLSELGLLLKQRTRFEPERDLAFLITEIVLVETGETESIELPIFFDPDPAIFGSRVTYLRRYSVLTALGLAPEDDDDGEADRVRNENDSRPPRPPENRQRQAGPANGQRQAPPPREPGEDLGECPECAGPLKRSKYPDRETGVYGTYCPDCYKRNR